VKIPSVNDFVQAGIKQVEAILTLPLTAADLNLALMNLTKSVNRLNTTIHRVDQFTEAMTPLMDDELIALLPELIRAMQQTAIPALQVLVQTQSQMANLASSLERLDRIMEDGFGRVMELPGLGLMSRLVTGGSSGSGGSSAAGGSGGSGRTATTSPPAALNVESSSSED
jgi:hypothetical protein